MNVDLLRLLEDPRLLHTIPLPQLEAWARQLPACFLAQTLLAARLKGSESYERQLAHASLMAADRGCLKDFMEKFLENTGASYWTEVLVTASALPEGGITPQVHVEETPMNTDPVEDIAEQQAIMLLEEEFAEEASYERQEEMLLVNETAGGGAEYLPITLEEQVQEPVLDDYSDDVEPRTALLLEEHINESKASAEQSYAAEQSPPPGQFLPDKVMPFQQWLKLFAAQPQPTQPTQTPQTPGPADEEAERRFARQHEQELLLIDHFVATYQQQPPRQQSIPSVEELSRQSAQLRDDIVSETLAAIYESQGLWEQAIRQYVKLSLKFPEKVSFFAARIRELKQKKR
ncbi:MAG: hypothetical protein NZL95_06845 [Chitinophagales bacterium]|nr:hypothetical protein [Chitinophagales bacterium]MDW8428254.1 hypothetical protein [Chitinophagales bacterium]